MNLLQRLVLTTYTVRFYSVILAVIYCDQIEELLSENIS